jgi:hypothetical protein
MVVKDHREGKRMAGPAITRVLEGQDRDTFYQFWRHYAEYIYVLLTDIEVEASLLRELPARGDFPTLAAAPASMSRIIEAAAAIKNLHIAQTIHDHNRGSFANDEERDKAFGERHAPFDGEAWDRYFEGHSALLGPLLSHVQGSIDEIDAALREVIDPLPGDLSAADYLAMWGNVNSNEQQQFYSICWRLRDSCQNATARLDPAAYDLIIADQIEKHGGW